jgi:hypothetical protein
MERITYRKTLDVHKNGTQFMLQGFETADNMSRVIEISLMASGDAVDFPLERVVAMMYVTTPGATEPSINECAIKDNKVVYDVLPIVVEGITTMQLKIIETSPDGAKSVLASPKFAVEVTKSNVDDNGQELKTTFTAIETFIAKAEDAYNSRLMNIELDSECVFKAHYADGTYYETDVLQRLFKNGNVLLSESYAHGGTGVRAGEDTDNSKYYSNISKSEALNAQNIMENSEEILEEVKLHGVYTAFKINFETGEVEYVSPSFNFNIDPETGELNATGKTYLFNDEVGKVVEEWCETKGIPLFELSNTSNTHTEQITKLYETSTNQASDISTNAANIKNVEDRVTPIEKGGTGASTVEEAMNNLSIPQIFLSSHVGDGNFGANNPTVIPIKPSTKLFIMGDVQSTNSRGTLVLVRGQKRTSLDSSGVGMQINATWTDDTLSFYHNSSASAQGNTKGETYPYLLIN